VPYSRQVRSISYLKANAAAIIAEIGESRAPVVITRNGEPKAVLEDVATWQERQESLALLKVLALGNREVAEGRVSPPARVVKRLRRG
jgi:prevent-host-death family protein